MAGQSSNKRVAKNTVILYFRMAVTMFIGLFTSRIILASLGIEDYGIYNVVGGLVPMFSFFCGALGAASSRFITYELGTGNKEKLCSTFQVSMTAHWIMTIFVVILLETAGLWLLNTKLVIPAEKAFAANVVYQFTVIGCISALTQIPASSCIIAHERFNIYAYLTFVDVIGKLLLSYSLYLYKGDRLILYGFLLLMLQLFVNTTYHVYCRKKFEEYSLKLNFERHTLRTMMSYSGWSLFGSLAYMLKGQGINIVLNTFFGPVVNAAFGIANQVNSKVNGFISNFSVALNPQIIKSYAAKDYNRTNDLLEKGAKFSFLLFLVISVPLIVNCDMILHIWLKEVPSHGVIFTQLFLLNALLETPTYSIGATIQATGNIKWYQIIVGIIIILNFPATWLFLKLGYPAYSSLVIANVITILSLIVRTILLKKEIKTFKMLPYIRDVYLRCLFIGAISFGFSFLIDKYSCHNLIGLVATSVCYVVITSTVVLSIGLRQDERKAIMAIIKNKVSFLNK